LQSVLTQPQPGFSKMLAISLLLHLAVLLSSLFLARGNEKRIFLQPAYTTVTIVGGPPGKTLPFSNEEKKTGVKQETFASVKETAEAPAKAVKKTAPVGKAAKKGEAERPEKEEAISITGKIASIEKKVKKREEEELVDSSIKGIKEKQEKKAVAGEIQSIRENILGGPGKTTGVTTPVKTVSVTSPLQVGGVGGVGLGGGKVTGELFEVRFKDYYNAVGAKIQSVWIYPGEAAKDLQTVLSIGIARSGELRSVRIEKKSGNSLFDESAIKAVKKAAPFAPIREEIKGDFLEIGVRFCPGGCSN